MRRKWKRRLRGGWRVLLTWESALIALAMAILTLLAFMAEVDVS